MSYQNERFSSFSSETDSQATNQPQLSAAKEILKKIGAVFLIALAVGGITVASLGIATVISLSLAAIIGIGSGALVSGGLGGWSTYRLFKGSKPEDVPLLGGEHPTPEAEGIETRGDIAPTL